MSHLDKMRAYHPNETHVLWNIFRKIALLWSVIGMLLVCLALFLASKYYDLLMSL